MKLFTEVQFSEAMSDVDERHRLILYTFFLSFSPQNSHEFIVRFSFKEGNNDSHLQTTLGQNVTVVLGITPDVVLFDKMRSEYKKHPKDTYC